MAARSSASKAKTTKKALASKSRTEKPRKTTTAPVLSHHGFMWKLLEQKKAAEKEKKEKAEASINPHDRVQPTASSTGFGRFAGPRRRVG